MAATALIGARVPVEEHDALAELAKRRHRTLADELRYAVAEHMRRVAEEEAAARGA
jgi:hypothetical protein